MVLAVCAGAAECAEHSHGSLEVISPTSEKNSQIKPGIATFLPFDDGKLSFVYTMNRGPTRKGVVIVKVQKFYYLSGNWEYAYKTVGRSNLIKEPTVESRKSFTDYHDNGYYKRPWKKYHERAGTSQFNRSLFRFNPADRPRAETIRSYSYSYSSGIPMKSPVDFFVYTNLISGQSPFFAIIIEIRDLGYEPLRKFRFMVWNSNKNSH